MDALTAFAAGSALLLVGGGVGWMLGSTRRLLQERLQRRSRLVYELAEGDVDNVAVELEEVSQAEPGDTTTLLALAALDRRRGRIDRAKAIHRTVMASASLPTDQRVAALVGLGRDLLAQGRKEAAVGALARAVSLAPRSCATLESLAKALEQAGAWERAAGAWERHEKLVEGRRRRGSRVARGHALAGLALQALGEGDDRKARRLVDRATELAPDSGHVWYVGASVESAVGDPHAALEAWQRCWELAGAGAAEAVAEAWKWAEERGHLEELVERMLASLRSSSAFELVIPLSIRVAPRHPELALAALERASDRSALAQLHVVRLRLSRGQNEEARDAAAREPTPPGLLCGACGTAMPRFRFRCDHCGAWDRCGVPEGADAGDARGPQERR